MSRNFCVPLKEISLCFPNGPYALIACKNGLHSIKQISDVAYQKAENSGASVAFELYSKTGIPFSKDIPPCLVAAIDWFQKYFKDPKQVPKALPQLCSLLGTPFRWHIWKHLALNTDSGSVITYKQLAESSGHPRAVRAVGSAMAQNPFSIIIPCHRVLPTIRESTGRTSRGTGKKTSKMDINIGRYSSLHGSRTKLWLLRHEGTLL